MQYGRAIKEKIKTADTDQVICERDETGKEEKNPRYIRSFSYADRADVDCRKKKVKYKSLHILNIAS
jgi:hypothetical protein